MINIKLFRKISAVFLALSVFCGCITFAADYRLTKDSLDLFIEKVYFSDQAFKVGDIVTAYIKIGCNGPSPTSQFYFFLRNMEGAKVNGQNWASEIYEGKIYSGIGATLAIPFVTITSEEVKLRVAIDEINVLKEVKRDNNTKDVIIKSKKNDVDLTVEKIYSEPSEFKDGDTVSVYADIRNVGGKNMPYSELTLNASESRGKYDITKRVTSLKAGESQKMYIGDVTARGKRFDVTVGINSDDAVEEGDYDNNTLTQTITSFITEKGYIWDVTATESGGYLPGGTVDYKNKIVYLRTDVGGSYRYDPKMDRLHYLNQNISGDDGREGSNGFEFYENDTNILFTAMGYNPETRGFKWPADVFRTMDGGKTWKGLDCPANFGLNFTLDATALDQNNPNVFYAVGLNVGLVRTDNALAASPQWEVVNLPGSAIQPAYDYVPAYHFNKSPTAVAIDNSVVENGRSKNVYVGTYPDGVFKSSDGGRSFSLMPDSPKGVWQIIISKEGTVYVLSKSEEHGGIWRCTGDKWEWIFPIKHDAKVTSMAVSGLNSDYIAVAAEYNLWYSMDAGKTWKEIIAPTFTRPSEHAKSNGLYQCNGIVLWDPINEKSLWLGDWFRAMKTEDITAERVHFNTKQLGYEELCMILVRAPYNADRLYTTHMDGSMIIQEQSFFNNQMWKAPKGTVMTNGLGMDYCKSNPDYIFIFGGTRWGNGDGDGLYTPDAGKTWVSIRNELPKNSNGGIMYFGQCAVSEGMNENGVPTVIGVPIRETDKLQRSADLGKTWQEVKIEATGLNIWSSTQTIAADTVKNGVFYFYDVFTGNFFVSEDDGVSFKKKSTLPMADGNLVAAYMRAMSKEGHLVLSLGGNGLWITTDGGESFRKVENMDLVHSVGSGKNAVGNDCDSIYAIATVNEQLGIFRSDDMGESWRKLSGETYDATVAPCSIDGDKHRPGVVYFGTSGRGVMVGMPADGDFRPVEIALDEKDERTVRSEEYILTGATSINVPVTINVNGNTTVVNPDEKNEFSYKMLLNNGENIVKVSAGNKDKGTLSEKVIKLTYNPDYIEIATNIDSLTTGADSYTITGMVNTEVELTQNGNAISVTGMKNAFSHTVALEPGENDIVFRAVDNKGNVYEKHINITRDILPPVVEFEMKDGENVYEPILSIKGTVDEFATISINDAQGEMVDKGEFAFPLTVSKAGESTIKLVATDRYGNSKEYSLNINFAVEDYLEDLSAVNVYYGIPTLDGVLDDSCWKTDRVIHKLYQGTTENVATFGLAADSSNLYFGIHVRDNNVYMSDKKDANMFYTDTVEICIDPQANRASTYDEFDVQLRLDTFGSVFVCTTGKYSEKAQSKVTKVEDGYIIEAKIPLSEINLKYAKGGIFNVDVSINDCDVKDGENAERSGVVGWCADSQNWTSTTKFGKAMFK